MQQLKNDARQQQGGQVLRAATQPSPRQLLLGLPVGALVAAALTAAPMPAVAVGFSGDYDPTNWTTTLSPLSDGSVDTTNAPNDITITGPNNGQVPSFINYTISAPSSGTVSFDWLYNTIDSPGGDSFGYLRPPLDGIT